MHVTVTPFADAQHALEELAYHGNTLSRWATSAKIARTALGENAYGDVYMSLTVEEIVKIEKLAAKLRAALAPASVQQVSREAQGVAA